MTVEITVGPPALTINKSSTFMVTDQNGEIGPTHAQGVFAFDTRFVSSYHFLVNGKPWKRVSTAAVSYDVVQLYLINSDCYETDGISIIPDGSLGLTITRYALEEGIREEFEITNYGPRGVSVVLEIQIMSDFSDLFEVKAKTFKQRKNMVTTWSGERAELITTYRREDYVRHFIYRVVAADQPPSYANGHLLFPMQLEPGATWRASGRMLLRRARGIRHHTTSGEQTKIKLDRAARLHERWVNTCTILSSLNPELNQSYSQAIVDMGALRLMEHDLGPDIWVPAAGVPWFVALFGRDSLISSLENMMTNPHFAKGALLTLAKYQARNRDDYTDAQPGKIMHELRQGELAHFKEVPHVPYYGTWDATPLYLIVLHQAWRWLGDRRLIQDLLPTAEKCLEWIDNYGDLDGDGFQEYKTFSSKGYEDMSWKDSGHAVVYPDGMEVRQPKALCELQGYVYAAKKGMAEIYTAFGDNEKARSMEKQAEDLKRRFNAVFWMEDEGTYAYGLDPDKHQIKSIVSNPGHCLWTGIVDDDKAERVVKRLLAADMWSGWGIRTLSSNNPAFNPFYYQVGAVWPHDNGIIATGMKQYGFKDEANKVAKGILNAAQRFESHRLPEVFSGLQEKPESFPVQYRGANTPQAWAAGSVFFFIHMMLGLQADAPNGRLYLYPTLPEWAPSIELKGLQVGKVDIDLRFWREGKESRFEVEAQRGGHVDVQSGGPSTEGGEWRLSA